MLTIPTFTVIGLLLAAPSGKELNAQGFELYKKGDFEGAYDAFTQATRAAPSLSIALYNRAALAAKVGRWSSLSGLTADLSASIEQDPGRLARVKVDHDFDSIRTTLAFQRLVGAPDLHTAAGLTALLPKLSWWRASAEKYSVGEATLRLLAGGRFEIDGQSAGSWRVISRPKRDPLVVIEVKEPARTLTGQLMPDGRLLFDDEWWTNERVPGAVRWAEPAEKNVGEAISQKLITEALAQNQQDPIRFPRDAQEKLLRAIDAAPRLALAHYELARLRGLTATECNDETFEGVRELDAAFALDPSLRERAKNDDHLAPLGSDISYWVLLGADLHQPADVAALLPKLHWHFGPPSQSDMGWGLAYAFKPGGRFELTERIEEEQDMFQDKRVGTWKVARAGNGVTVLIDVPASRYAKATHLVGRLTNDGRLLFEAQWWRSGLDKCCC